jgi:CheY-like chemotaxis protein
LARRSQVRRETAKALSKFLHIRSERIPDFRVAKLALNSRGSSSLEEPPVILVVEDDPPIQIIVEDALADGGFEPAITASGEEAVTLLKGHKGKYHALVVDIALLGRLDGWEVAKRAREIDPAFPILYITAGHADQWPSQGVPNSGLLTKPFAPAQLVTAVSSAVAHRPDLRGERAGGRLNYKGIEYSLKSVEPGIWEYRFYIGRAIKTGTTKVSHEHLAIRRIEERIGRELFNAGLYPTP